MKRLPRVRAEITRWDWVRGGPKDREPVDITDYMLAYSWQKTVKNPAGEATVTLFPQRRNDHILDSLETMDVVRIYEFGTHKFSGYIRRINYSGSIGNDGKPSRQGSLSISSFGGLLTEPTIGLNLGNATGQAEAILESAAATYANIANAVTEGASYADLIRIALDSWFTLLRDVGADIFADYFDRHLDYTTGIQDIGSPAIPREFQLYTGTEDSIPVWDILQQLVEAPFNELWVDDGPRTTMINGSKAVLGEDIAYLVLRPTPFDGTVTQSTGPQGGTAFQRLPIVEIVYDLFNQFNFAKSMDEVYSVFTAIPAAYNFGNFFSVFLGNTQIDKRNLNKFLYKPLVTQLFYTQMARDDETEAEVQPAEIENEAELKALTLRNWFRNNDQFLAGGVSELVPEDHRRDPKIGQRIAVPDVEGSFYCEAVTHQWQYQGALSTQLTVTRGWEHTRNEPIELSNRIFRRTLQ